MVASMCQPGSEVSPGSFNENSSPSIGRGDKAASPVANRYWLYSMEKFSLPGRLILLPAGLVKASIISSIWHASISLRLPTNFSMEVRSRCRFRAEGNSRNLPLSKIIVSSRLRAISPHNRAPAYFSFYQYLIHCLFLYFKK